MADFSRFTRMPDSSETARHQQPQQQLRPQAEREQAPDAFQKQKEREGSSEWSGGSMGGGVWAGRSR